MSIPLCWFESGKQSLLEPDLMRQTTEQIKRIRDKILTAQSCQKSYADQRRKFLEFQEGEHVFLKITPMMGIGKAMKVKKLSPRFLSPLQILKRVRLVAYQMALPPNLSNLHDIFHMSQLRKYHSDPSHLLEPESVQLREDLTFNLLPSWIVHRGAKQLRNKTVPLVKVA